MEETVRCQSCGMPMGTDAVNWGTEADQTPSSEYCRMCYQGGQFTQPDRTVDEMVQSSIDYMTAKMGFEKGLAEKMSNEVIRGLRRWH